MVVSAVEDIGCFPDGLLFCSRFTEFIRLFPKFRPKQVRVLKEALGVRTGGSGLLPLPNPFLEGRDSANRSPATRRIEMTKARTRLPNPKPESIPVAIGSSENLLGRSTGLAFFPQTPFARPVRPFPGLNTLPQGFQIEQRVQGAIEGVHNHRGPQSIRPINRARQRPLRDPALRCKWPSPLERPLRGYPIGEFPLRL